MKPNFLYAIPLLATLFLAGCGGDPAPAGGTGSTNTDITDAASDSFTQVWLEIDKITAKHKESGITEELTTATTQGAFDLLSLRDFSERLATKLLPEGEYEDIKVELVPGSKIVVFDLQGERKEITLTSSTLPMTTTFTVLKDTSTTLAIDFDVDQWEADLSTQIEGTAMDVAKLPLKKATVVKSVIVKLSGILEKTGTDYFLDLPAEKVKHKLAFDANTDMSDFDSKIGSVYEVEGLLTAGEIAIDEMELQEDNAVEDDKVILEGIKVYGIIEFVNTDDTGVITSIQVKVKKASKMLDTMSINIILDGVEPVKYINGTDASALSAGSKVKVLGEMLSTSLEDMTAYTVVIKSGEIKPKVGRKKFEEVEMIKCDTTTLACEFHSSATSFGKELVVNRSRLETNNSTTRCFDTGEYIGVKIEGRLSLDETQIFVKELKSEQRCETETTFVKGWLANYTDATCSALDNDAAIVKLEGKMEVISYTDISGNTVLLDEEEIVFKIRRSNGALRIKSEDPTNKTNVYNFLSLPEDAKYPGIMAVGNTIYVYSDIDSIGQNHDAELTMSSVGGYIEITNIIGETVVIKPRNKKDHKKAIQCNFDIVDDLGANTGVIITDGKTRWLGKQYSFQDTRKVKAVVDENNVAKSIRFGKLQNPTSEKATIEDLLEEDLTQNETESDAEYGTRMIKFQTDLKDALRDALKGGLEDDKLGKKEHKEKDSKSDREQKYEDKNKKRKEHKKLKEFDFDDFVDDMEKMAEDIYDDIKDASDIQSKSDVINKMSDDLKGLAEKIQKKMENYSLPEGTLPNDIQELVDSLGNISKLYDVFNKHEPFFDEDELNENKAEFGDDKSDDEKKGLVVGDKVSIDGIEYTIAFPTQAMTGYGTLDFTDWELVKVVDTLSGTTDAKYYLEMDEDIYARTGDFNVPATGLEIVINKLEVITPELGSKIHDLETPNLKADVDYGLQYTLNGEAILDSDKESAIYITYDYDLDTEIRYDYQLNEGETYIFTKLSKDTTNIRVYNFEQGDDNNEFMTDVYTDLTYQTKHSKNKQLKINFDVNLRMEMTPSIADVNGERYVLDNTFVVHGMATIDGKAYRVIGNQHHTIIERELDDGTIDRLVAKTDILTDSLDENGKIDTDSDGITDKQYTLNGVPLANWVLDNVYNPTDSTTATYLTKRYGRQSVAMLKLDPTDATTPTNFYLNGREYPLDRVTLTRIEEEADLLHVSPYSKKRDVAYTDGLIKSIHQATSIQIDFNNGRIRTITDSENPTDKISIRENAAPIANPDTATVDEDGSVTIDVLLNDTDADGDILTIESATAINGKVEIT